MFKGRKVTDPVVQGIGASAYDNKTDLNKAWETVGKAKSELRKIEHRLDEVERYHVPSMLNQTGETSITDYGPSDMNTTFNVSEQYPSAVLVDNYGRSAYLKSKTQNSRKVSRLEDKYSEDQDELKEIRKKSSTRKQEHKAANTRVKPQSLQLQEKKYGNHDNLDQGHSLRNKVTGNRHVEFSDHVHVRSNHNTVNNGYHLDSSEEQSTLTNSRDIRETEINFLNNNLTRNLHALSSDDRGLTHVSVTVPGATNQKTAFSSRSGSNRKSGADPKSQFLDLVSESPEMDGRISDASHSDSESGRSRKFKGIKNLDPDGLLKIKETIRKQQSKSAAANRDAWEDMQGAAAPGNTDPATQPLPQRHLHDPYEPILPRPLDLIEGAEKAPKVRKIAAGPAAPTYKGFSEAEVKYRLVESKGAKQTDGSHKDKKRQMKRTEPLGTWLTVEETEGKNKKITRVIAPSKKALKQQPQPKNKEIITTSSWRAGQELILRELGPAKKSGSKSAKHRDLDLDHDDACSPYDDRPETQGGDDHIGGGATAAEIQHHKALSEEARRVYSDLHMDNEDGRQRTTSEKERHWKAPTKRKAPKNTDKDTQQQPCAKQRHYDADQIRRYMQRQRADRVRQQKEEESRRREEDEARRRQLEELYNKQKQASASAAAHGGKKEKNRQKQVLEAMQAAGLVTDMGKHTSTVHDRARFMFGEDKENVSEGEGEDMEVSDSSSTLTGDASDLETPTATLLRNKMDIDGVSNSRTLNTKDVLKPLRQKNIDLPEPPASNARTFLGDLSIDVNSVTSKFTQALQEKLNTEPRSLSGRFNGLNGEDNYLSDLGRLHDGGARSRAERIQAIKDTAATLQNRLKEEARKIQAQSVTHSDENGASKPSVRWNDADVRTRDREEEFMSRYERVTAANDKFSVFTSNLPGSQPRSVQPEPSGPSPEAIKPSKHTSNRVPDKIDDTITETSTFSEITLTDESDSDDLMGRKIGTGLRKTEYHVGSSKSDLSSKPLNIPPPTQPVVKASNSWESPSVDDYNVFSIYSRRQQERIIRPGREPMSKKKPTVSAVSESDLKAARSHDQSAAPQPKPRGARSTSPGLGSRSQPVEPLRTLSSSERTKSQPRFTADTEEDEETLHEESYTQSFESEEITKHRSISEKNAAALSQKSLPSTLKTASARVSSRKPDRMSPDVESSINEEFSQDEATPRADIAPAIGQAPSDPPRLSPTSLEQKFYSALNDLETMEMSIKQLTTVDRTRAVAMAQQETVSLAQMLKAKQQAHELQMKEIQLKAQAEANESTKQLEDYRKRASESVFTAADEIAKARGEGSSLSETTKKLIESQTEAVKALTDAVKATVPGVEGARAKPRVEKSREHEETESQANYSMDDSLTEDESFFAILPSQSHRKKGKQHHSDNESVTSEASSTRILDHHDFHSLFAGEEGFDKFTEEMVRQFMKEEELRAHHQASLLRLRENALLEKTKAELQWLEQQKQHIRNKGADDAYPQIKKRQRGLKMKLQEQQDEIRRLREENKAAAKERQRKLYEEISKRQAARSKATKVTEGQAGVKGRLARPADVHTEAEFSSYDEGSDADKQRKKSSKSDSEMNTEPKSTARTPRHESVLLERFQKNYLDERNLTQRQSRLMDRRKNAEELLKWKKILDAEEARVYKLEKKALKVWDTKDKDASSKKDPSLRDPSLRDSSVRDPSFRDPSLRDPSLKDPSLSTAITSRHETDKPSSRKDTATTKESTIKTVSAVSVSHDHDTTAVSENITTARDESLYTSIKEDLPTASVEVSSRDKHSTLMNDSSNRKNHNRSGSESSVMEEIQSQSSVEDSKRMNDSSDDTMTHSYNNETFEDTTTQTRTTPRSNGKKAAGAPKSPLDNLKKQMPGLSSPRSPKSLFSHRSQTKTSESESEDSFSDTKSVSELSDFEGRIRALNEELRKRKTEAEKLKRERKRKKKEHMKNKEETLKKQIEAYDSQIKTLRSELRKEINQEPSSVHTVRPQIKKPQVVSPSTKGPKTTPTKPAQTGLDGSEPESAQVSPVSVEDSKSTPPKTPTTSTSKVSKSLDRISEGSESATSRSERTESSFREKMQSIKDLVSDIDKTEEIEEEVVSEEILEASEASDEKSGIEIDLHSNRDIWEVSVQSRGPEKSEYDYSEDFVTEGPNTTQRDKSHLSLRSEQSEIAEDVFSQTRLDTARSTAEISEAISERLPTASASESFVNKLDLNVGRQGKEHNGANEEESDAENERSSIIGSSRPSSGRSERSQFSSVTYTTEHETSESEKSPGLPNEKDFEEEDVSLQEVNTKTAKAYTGTSFDIDDLLGTPEELTPMPSPRDESSRGHSQSSRMSHFFDPLGDFEIGDQVSLTAPSGERTVGTLLFKGNVQFAPGVWAGVELEEPEGRHDGIEDGVRYFTCKARHGLIVPGHDIQQVIPEEIVDEEEEVDVRASIDSVNTEDGELLKMIMEADKRVQEFGESPSPSPREPAPGKTSKEILAEKAEKITDDLFKRLLTEEVKLMTGNKSGRTGTGKKGPPVAPKPKSRTLPESQITDKANHVDMDLEEFLKSEKEVSDHDQFPDSYVDSEHVAVQPAPVPAPVFRPDNDSTSDSMITNFLNEAIGDIFAIRSRKREQAERGEIRTQVKEENRESGIFDTEDDDSAAVAMPELDDVLGRTNDNVQQEAPPRPGSPVPGLQSSKDSHKPMQAEESGTFEYDDIWDTPTKAPPPYNDGTLQYKKASEEVSYAVPHEEHEIKNIVSSAVDEFWEQRRYGEPLADLQPSDAFLKPEPQSGTDIVKKSRLVFKKLLFDLTGEVIRSIYQDDEYDSPVAWHKPKQRRNKFYKGSAPPTTVDVLKPVVQQAVVEILGLNGAKKGAEKPKWGIRKKKDLVDSILVQELREEEPDWVNYDDYELAVKMQLTETIFDDLLTDTVQTMNKIFRKKQIIEEQQKSAV
ncbi:centrosome-associated protein 350-like [Dreissena polymorpha]|uniref:centrosome-associated protein 350-like n=1 Tax=Dreissena polymorpha TaxID=45954 RepID=UPI0022653962|nr:centrosome-associated protein 350-like [Dreissena polymorpha]